MHVTVSDKGFDFHFSFLPLAVRTLVNVLSLNNFCKSIVMIAKVQSPRIFVYSLFFKTGNNFSCCFVSHLSEKLAGSPASEI